jgi:hypothetical protein
MNRSPLCSDVAETDAPEAHLFHKIFETYAKLGRRLFGRHKQSGGERAITHESNPDLVAAEAAVPRPTFPSAFIKCLRMATISEFIDRSLPFALAVSQFLTSSGNRNPNGLFLLDTSAPQAVWFHLGITMYRSDQRQNGVRMNT